RGPPCNDSRAARDRLLRRALLGRTAPADAAAPLLLRRVGRDRSGEHGHGAVARASADGAAGASAGTPLAGWMRRRTHGAQHPDASRRAAAFADHAEAALLSAPSS